MRKETEEVKQVKIKKTTYICDFCGYRTKNNDRYCREINECTVCERDYCKDCGRSIYYGDCVEYYLCDRCFPFYENGEKKIRKFKDDNDDIEEKMEKEWQDNAIKAAKKGVDNG